MSFDSAPVVGVGGRVVAEHHSGLWVEAVWWFGHVFWTLGWPARLGKMVPLNEGS